MNNKRIKFVAQSYLGGHDDAARSYIELFLPVWEVQAEAFQKATENLEASGWKPQDPADLEALYWAEKPMLPANPAPVPAAALAGTARAVAAALASSETAGKDMAAGVSSIDWDALVAATPLDLAGSDPSAYLAASLEAIEGAFPEADVEIVGAVLSMALKPYLEAVALKDLGAIADLLANTEAHRTKPRTCPVCGCEAALGHVGPTDTVKTNARTLYCGQCGATWEFERIRCVRCGTQDQDKLRYRSVEGDDAHRIHVCDTCKGYLRTHFAEADDLMPFSPEVENVAMASLDAIAQSLGLNLGSK